jgi:hypothetical protein
MPAIYPNGKWKNPAYLNVVSGNKQMYGGGNTKYSTPGSQGRPVVMFSIIRKKTSIATTPTGGGGAPPGGGGAGMNPGGAMGGG